jgi:ABC-type multidrug transport system ATPase subunit
MLENEDIFDGIGADENLTLVGVTVEHNKHRVVDDLSLIVKKNEIFVFIGENGSGKSTVL